MKRTDIYSFDMFVDCGAPTLYNRLSRKFKLEGGIMGSTFANRKHDDYSYVYSPEYEVYRDKYIEFLLEHKDQIGVYSNLDVINSPELTWRNQQILEDAGLDPMPVFHLGNDPVWAKRYTDNYEYLAIGGMHPNRPGTLMGTGAPGPLINLFKDHLTDNLGFPKVKLHGFACTSVPLMVALPWHSVDSTVIRKHAMYGKVILPLANTVRKYSSITVSTRDARSKLDENYGGVTIDRFRQLAAEHRYTIEELGVSTVKRMIINAMYFKKLVESLPAWPWSIATKKAKKGADGRLTFYMAGSLSKKEERLFWNIMSPKLKNAPFIHTRLVSFFYRAEAEFVLGLKGGLG